VRWLKGLMAGCYPARLVDKWQFFRMMKNSHQTMKRSTHFDIRENHLIYGSEKFTKLCLKILPTG
jgi:hypothetical protein